MKRNKKDQEIINKLKQMPQIKDHSSKDEWFQQISTRMNHKKTRVKDRQLKARKNAKRFIPIFSMVFVVAIVLIMIPSIMKLDNFSTTQNDLDNFSTMESASDEQENIVENDKAINNDAESYLIQTIDNDSTIIHGAVADNELQYTIPISIIVPKTEDISSFYNDLDAYLDESGWGVRDYMFSDITFDIDLAQESVVMDVPEDYSLGEGEAKYNMFSELLTTMFRPYGINEVVFKTDDPEGINLGPYGKIPSTPLHEDVPSNYKLFQVAEAKRAFLIPIPQKDATISEALEDQKVNEEFYNIYQTVPETVDFEVEPDGVQLDITFSDDSLLENDQEYMTMIEAMLMTAKSFGYDFVRFHQTIIEQIGIYDLTEHIPVPEAINPIENK